MPYEFFVHDVEIRDSLRETLDSVKSVMETEKTLEIVYRPQALFRVRAVTRCSSSMPGIGRSIIMFTI